MKILKFLILSLAFLSSFIEVQAQSQSNEYDRDAIRKNEQAKRARASENKRAFELALERSFRCGDNICRAEDEETYTSCPLDCHSEERGIISYNGQSVCSSVKAIYEPRDVDELTHILKEISSEKEGRGKIRFLGARHSTSSILCTDGYVILSTNFSKLEDIKIMKFQEETVVSVPSGVRLGELVDYLDAKGYSLGFGYPMYRGVTLGGLLATGSHGSSRKHTAVSSQNIREISIINSSGEKNVLTLKSDPDEFRAAKVNLGLMGFVYNIKLKIYPQFNIKMNISSIEGLVPAKGMKIKWGEACDFEIIKWFPSINNAVKYCGTKTREKAFKNAESVVFGQDKNGYMFPRESYKVKIMKFLLEISRRYPSVGKFLSKISYKDSFDKTGYVYESEGSEIFANNIIGKSNKMLHNRLTKGFFQSFSVEDFSFSFPMNRADEVLRFVKNFSEEDGYAFPIIGFYMRFAKSENYFQGALLSNVQKDGEKEQLYVMAEFFEYQYFNLDKKYLDKINKRRFQLLKTLINKFGVSLHWGKSSLDLFRESQIPKFYGENLSIFKNVIQKYDPDEMFRNDFSDVLL